MFAECRQKIITSPMRQVTVRIDSGEDEGLFLEALTLGDGKGRGIFVTLLSRYNL